MFFINNGTLCLIVSFPEEFQMFDEEIKINNEPPKEPRKPPTLLIFGIAMVGGTVLVALGFRIMMSMIGAL